MNYLHAGANLTSDGWYRYWLSRQIGPGDRIVLFVGLNPSTADATKDDPTIRKCVGFARRWGFDWLYMCNLHAYRSTDPKALRRLESAAAMGPDNVEVVRAFAVKAEIVVAAWGQNRLGAQADHLAAAILRLPHCRALGFNADGTPRHPLYLPYTTPLVPCP